MTESPSTNQEQFLLGVKHAIPISVGYFSISITFGVLSTSGGLSIFETTAMSMWVFAGASQFIALNLIGVASAFEIIFATFILNLRHLLMSTTLARKIKASKKSAAALSFGITDETFAVATLGKEQPSIQGSYFAGVALVAYLSWLMGTIVGAVFGEFIPASITNSLGIALYAMFIALLTPAIKSSRHHAYIAGLSALTCTGLYYMIPALSDGWSIVISTVFAATFGLKLQVYNLEKEEVA
ncbi:AzlC family ABC transporter permease [Caldalkalibacillus salinus]|uniref:AzlC family ABC transporter permease n=1 Tax=Caldalkalibacillus salinus TaxID=2803787 RepID=UPI001920BC58|nr:AzlC family ABC transporter permease [Caldalkalibacillus salinus]